MTDLSGRYGRRRVHVSLLAAVFLVAGIAARSAWPQTAARPTNSIRIDWTKTILISRSTPTLQVVVNPMLRSGSPIHDAAFRALRQMQADFVRYVPWLPYPRLAVAELKPPTPAETSWDFSLIDPMTKDFLAATAGHTAVMNFSTIPAWLFQTDKPVTYPADPNHVDWSYTQGTHLVDPSGKQLGDYYGRLVSWYTRGGFTDENGVRHNSGYHYSFPIWEVLNEVDFEHTMTPEQYTRRYDAIVSAIHEVSPETEFMGLALAKPTNPAWFEYFLDPTHHRAGIPLDYISYHFYASPTASQTIDDWQYSFFDQADGFLHTVRYIQGIRQRLSPKTKTDIDELGVILPNDNRAVDDTASRIPALYWNAAGAMYAYLYLGLTKQGVEIVGESQLVGYPTQFPSVSMIDWKTGQPNARYWVLWMLRRNFGPGDKLVATDAPVDGIAAQAFSTSTGKKLLLVNERNRSQTVTLPDSAEITAISTVDGATGEQPPRTETGSGGTMTLAPFAVSIVEWR